MKKYIILLLFLASSHGFSQTINNYKYAIVPSKFAFLKENDQYRLNTLTKMLMEKYGFVTFFDTDILPTEVAESNCNKVFVEVLNNGNMFKTKISVVLKDCKNTVLFTSEEGKSQEKEYQVAYNQALREAFNSFETLAKKEKAVENFTLVKFVYTTPTKSVTETTLFAQPIENGFQLIDSIPKVIMKIYKTSSSICFIAIKDNRQGVLISRDNQWFFEYISNLKLVSEKVEVKF